MAEVVNSYGRNQPANRNSCCFFYKTGIPYPKYRVPGNLGTALGEMHKYRDGIVHRDTGRKAVAEVYILTPTKTEQTDGLRFFQEDFHRAYQMEAVQMVPGEESEELRRKILSCFYELN
jgi:hypothetical protein